MQPFSPIQMDIPQVTVAEFCRRSGLKEKYVRDKIAQKGQTEIPVIKMGKGSKSAIMINIAKMTERALVREY